MFRGGRQESEQDHGGCRVAGEGSWEAAGGGEVRGGICCLGG